MVVSHVKFFSINNGPTSHSNSIEQVVEKWLKNHKENIRVHNIEYSTVDLGSTTSTSKENTIQHNCMIWYTEK